MKSLLLLASLFSLFIGNLAAQDIPCSAFCVTNITTDTTQPNTLLVTILFTGDDNAFINYPHVSSIIDQQGDTIATGTLNFFGQFANTSQDYPVTTVLDSIPGNFNVTVNFRYDTLSCALVYPCLTPTDNITQPQSRINIFPNPSSNEISIHSQLPLDETTLMIFNAQGRWVCQLENMVGYTHSWNHQQLPAGMYVMHLTREDETTDIKKVIIVE